MIETRALRAILASLVLSMVLGGAKLTHAQTLSVSIPSLRLAPNERVVAFEIRVTSGRIASLPNLPIGWHISVDNDPSWNTAIRASSRVGAAALGPDFFRKFVVIEKNTSLGNPFDVVGEVDVTRNFATGRRIKLRMADFVLQ
jgi:hypothetical protein